MFREGEGAQERSRGGCGFVSQIKTVCLGSWPSGTVSSVTAADSAGAHSVAVPSCRILPAAAAAQKHESSV